MTDTFGGWTGGPPVAVPGVLDNRGVPPGILGMVPEPLLEQAQVTQNPQFARLPQRSQWTPPALNLFGTPGPRLDRNYQRNLTTLVNKYEELSPFIRQLPPEVRDSLIRYDSTRVARGSAPLTREQTQLAAESAVTNEQATPEPDRSPLSFLSNIGSDLGQILHSLPRVPAALVNEALSIPRFGQHIAQAQAAGESPVQALLNAPGIRMVPGTYTLSNILRGGEGISEAVSHPVMTFLDVLPIAGRAAAATRVGQAGAARAAAAGRPARPLSTILTNQIGRTGTIERNVVGRAIDWFRTETQPGIQLEAFGGAMARDVALMLGKRGQRLKGLMLGVNRPAFNDVVETFGPRLNQILDRYTAQYPFLGRDARGPMFERQRTQFYEDIKRNPNKYDPALVNELRDLQVDMGRYTTSLQLTDLFDGELYPIDIANKLNRRQTILEHSQRMGAFRNALINPSGTLTIADFSRMADDVDTITDATQRAEAFAALEQTLDAYGIEPLGRNRRRDMTQIRQILADPNTVLRTRMTQQDIVRTLRTHRQDYQAGLLEAYMLQGKVGKVTERLDRFAARRPPTFPQSIYPDFRNDVRSMSRRLKWEQSVGRKYTPQRHAGRLRAMERSINEAPPARFEALIRDEQLRRGIATLQSQAEVTLGRRLTPEEAGRFARNVEHEAWRDLPGIDPLDAAAVMQRLEREVAQTWRALKAAGHDPIFVHRVSPHRAQQTLAHRIGPVPTDITQAKRRTGLGAEVRDIRLSLTHQATELLSRRYSEDAIIEIMSKYGRTEAQLRDDLLEVARARAERNPVMDVQSHLSELIKHRYEKFNPENEGFSWGGARLNRYRQEGPEATYIPKAIAQNLHRYAKRPGPLGAFMEPLTRLFRYNVIGLSPSIIINNFLSNGVAMTAEIGPQALKHWETARKWASNPRLIPNEELRAMFVSETPYMEHLNTEAWMRTGSGQRFMSGFNGAHAFMDSNFARAAGTVKQKLDFVVKQSLRAQQWGDNVFRAMTYLDQLERKGRVPGMTTQQAENAAMEMVRRTFVDYASFTPIERTGMRTMIPFYSYMGHAARFVARYPLNHPMRASIMAHIAQAEHDRLGALPGSFLSMFPLFSMGADGKQTFFNLRPFDPFGDTADLTSFAGWVAAMNPAAQTVLQQIGVIRGESEIYPTLRYDPETGRMRAVRGNVLLDLLHNTVPRLGLITSPLGLNPAYNELRQRDPAAANRSLLGQAGIPRAWRSIDVPLERMKAELTRKQSAEDALADAMRTGNWGEAMRYPSLRAYYEQLQQLTPDQLAAMTPAEPEAIEQQISQMVGA